MKISPNYMIKAIAGQYCILPLGQRIIDSASIIRINDCAALILKKVEEGKNTDEILEALFHEYKPENDEDRKTLKEDLLCFLDEAKRANIVIE